MSQALANGVLAVVKAAVEPLIDEIKVLKKGAAPNLADAVMDSIEQVTAPLHDRIKQLEQEKASACDRARKLEVRVAALEKALGLS